MGDPLERDVVVRCEAGDPEDPDAVILGRLQVPGQRVEAEQVLVVGVPVGDVLKHDLYRERKVYYSWLL